MAFTVRFITRELQSGSINYKNYIIVIIGSVLVRSCGCIINDISDFRIDKYIARTLIDH